VKNKICSDEFRFRWSRNAGVKSYDILKIVLFRLVESNVAKPRFNKKLQSSTVKRSKRIFQTDAKFADEIGMAKFVFIFFLREMFVLQATSEISDVPGSLVKSFSSSALAIISRTAW